MYMRFTDKKHNEMEMRKEHPLVEPINMKSQIMKKRFISRTFGQRGVNNMGDATDTPMSAGADETTPHPQLK